MGSRSHFNSDWGNLPQNQKYALILQGAGSLLPCPPSLISEPKKAGSLKTGHREPCSSRLQSQPLAGSLGPGPRPEGGSFFWPRRRGRREPALIARSPGPKGAGSLLGSRSSGPGLQVPEIGGSGKNWGSPISAFRRQSVGRLYNFAEPRSRRLVPGEFRSKIGSESGGHGGPAGAGVRGATCKPQRPMQGRQADLRQWGNPDIRISGARRHFERWG